MNTPAHLILGAAAFGRPDSNRITVAAILGGLAPDLSLYTMVAVSMFVLDIPANVIFDQLYFSDAWQQVFAIDNSFVLWSAVLALAIWKRQSMLIAFSGAAILHLVCDFPFHGEDARMHFWPLSDWKFVSPVSYWDPSHHGGAFGTFELALSVALVFFLLIRFRQRGWRVLIIVLGLMEVLSSGIWRFVF